jgi:hypothetical protein
VEAFMKPEDDSLALVAQIDGHRTR